nr:RNA-directed DNA polymerase, eukaryota, reverse transcriptase zinc-binding domain protein [Tanacetum cinerariifolium]
ISLIGSLYKIIAKILANRLVTVLGDVINEIQSAFVADRQILDGPFILNEVLQWCKLKKKQSFSFKIDFENSYDSVRWDYLEDVLKKFGFGEKWCKWIRECLRSSWGSVIVNGSPTEEFQFFKGLKQGDPLSSFLFILIMESLHLTFQNVVDADDAMFVGQWSNSNIDTIIYALKCFERASGLCSKVGGCMSRIQNWNDAVENMSSRLSKWKMKTLSIGGRLNLIKAVLGAMPIYHMSIFKVPLGVLKRMESIRCRFFNGADLDSNKAVWVLWNNVLASKEKGGLGVSSLYALNRALLFKWVWRFITQKNSLWARVISAIHGTDGKIGTRTKSGYNSLWSDIVFEMEAVKDKMADLFSFMQKRLGDGVDTCFWKGTWNGELPFKLTYPRLYALEVDKNISVADKLAHATLARTFRREPRSGIETVLLAKLEDQLKDVQLVNKRDRWAWSLNGSDNFKKVCRWWNVDFAEASSYDEWLLWISSLRIHGKHKKVLEEVCYGLWWHLWFFRNKWMFGQDRPSMERLFDDVVLRTFYWIQYRCKVSFSWVEWLKNPYLVFL